MNTWLNKLPCSWHFSSCGHQWMQLSCCVCIPNACTLAIGTKLLSSIHYEQPLGFRTDWPSLNWNQWQNQETSLSLHHLWKSLTQHIHTPVLKRKITYKTKFITSLNLHLEMRKGLTGSLETITVWQISGAFISKNFSQLFTSSSVFRGQAENSGGYSKSKSFISERKTLVSRHFFSSNFPLLFPSPIFCSHSFLPKSSSPVPITVFLPEKEVTRILILSLHR